MLQQTTVGTVVNHFDRFISIYPSLSDLAASSEEEILINWKGLGYYRRAKNLRRACIEIEDKHSGVIPKKIDELVEIGGIGPYTSSALISIGQNQRALAVDANLERVLSRIYGIGELKGPKLQREIRDQFDRKEILKEFKSGFRGLNEALMDLGRVYCRSKKVSCELCPMSDDCFSFNSGDPLRFPKELAKKINSKNFELTLARIIVKKNGKVLGYKKDAKQWLSGQFEIPTFIISSEDKKLTQYPVLSAKPSLFKDATSYKTSITKYKITNLVIAISEKEFLKNFSKDSFIYKGSDLEKSNFSTASIKAMKKVI
jgi:A/G-specific adenine glycosylase